MSGLKLMKKFADKHLPDPMEMPEVKCPVPDDLIEEFNVEYIGRDGNKLITNIFRQKNAAEEKLPVIILLHGGGLFFGHPIIERNAAEAFARKGYLVFVPSYRLLTEADACGEIADICAALDFAESRLEEYGGDRSRMFVVAESAGAYLAVYAATMTKSRKLCEMIGYEPAHTDIKSICFVSGMFYVTRKDLLGLLYPKDIFRERRKDREFMKYMDPECEEVIRNIPPAILTTSRNDPLRKYTMKFAEALNANRVQHKLLYYAEKNKELIHAFPTICPDLPESKDAHTIIDAWFRQIQ